jgi:hypothetical protein
VNKIIEIAIAPSAPPMIAPQSVARPFAAGAVAALTTTSSTSVTAMAGLRAMTLPPMVAGDEKLWSRERNRGEIVPGTNCTHGDVFMAGILLWLMGVPLIVIILLYLIF